MEPFRSLQLVVNALAPRAFAEGLSTLSRRERNIYLCWCYPAAVDNGGHASFFYNSTGEHAKETVEALLEVGAPAYATILNRAIAQFPGRDVPANLKQRNTVFAKLSSAAHSQMEACDNAFLALGSEALLGRLHEYWGGRAT